MSGTVTHCGKQVLENGAELAQAASPEAAARIVRALADRASIAAYLEAEAVNKRRSAYVRQLIRALAGNVLARLDIVEVAPKGEMARYNDEAKQ